MSNQRFTKKVEIWINVSILIFLMTINIYALGTKSFNSSRGGQFCLYAVTPAGCQQSPDLVGECKSSPDPDAIAILKILTSVFIPVACLLISVVLLSFLLYKIVLNEKIFSVNSTRSTRNENVNNVQNEEQSEQEKNLPKESITAESDSSRCNSSSGKSKIAERISNMKHHQLVRFINQHLRLRTSRSNIDDSTETNSRAYRQEMTVQLLLYCCSFVLSYLLFAIVQIVLFVKNTPSLPLAYATKALYPLQGLFNIIIFLRPAVRVTKIRRPGTSWIKAYYLVIKNGGESLQERYPVLPVLPHIPVDSVKYGVENYVHPWIRESEGVEDVSKECRYVDSSMELSRGNAAFNSCSREDWYYVKGDEDENVDNVEEALVGIHHNDLDVIVEVQADDDEEEEEKDEEW
jgi:hypothetical protein